MKSKTATLLIVKPGKSLSSQLIKKTGDSFNTISFEIFERGDFIRHKKTGKQFIVMSKTEFSNLNKISLERILKYFKFRYKLTLIRKK